MGSYEFIRHNGVIGAIMPKPEDMPAPMWHYYFRCADIDLACKAVTENGGHVTIGPEEISGGQEGNELTVEFSVLDRSFIGLNGAPNVTPNESVSFMVVTENQEETDHYWNTIIANGSVEVDCGWCKDRWGFAWQITPQRLLDLVTSDDRAEAQRAFEAMMTMKKIDIAALDAVVTNFSLQYR